MKKIIYILLSLLTNYVYGQTIFQDSTKTLNEVVVSASRIEESIFKSPISITKISASQLQNSPSIELISSLARYKGIDVNQSSWFVTSLSTRGFNSSKAERLLQLADNVEFMSPTSSLYGGNWMGTPDLDIDNIEVIYGANSALYGSGALNGVILMNSKDPFKNQGLAASVRGGSRSLFDTQIRYAQVFAKRFAFKLNANFITGNEFLGESDAAIKAVTEGGLAGSDATNNAYGSPFGWNKINYFGDIGSTISNPDFTKYNDGKPYRIYMPGFKESEILSANAGSKFGLLGDSFKAGNVRLNPSLHFKINEHTKASYEYRKSIGNGIFQSTSRFAWREMQYDLHKFEIKNDRWFVRAYSMFDYGGKAYELGGVANALQNMRMTDPSNGIFPTIAANYFSAWNQIFAAARGNGFGGGNLAGVYTPDAVNGGVPTTFSLPSIQGGQSIENAAKVAFDLTKNLQITSNPIGASNSVSRNVTQQVANGVGDLKINGTSVKGAAFANTARNVDFSAQREFRFKSTNVVLGGAYRTYLLKSNGTLFSDGIYSPLNTEQRNVIINWESGVYGQFQQKLFDEKLTLATAARLDYFKNFDPKLSPRISAVYATGNHNFRANYSTAYRAPAQLDQYIYLDYGSILLIGNTQNGFKGLNSAGTAPYDVKKLAPEKMNSWEIGYKSMLTKDLQIDLSYYRSLYNGFIGIVRFQGREDGIMPEGNFTGTKTGDWAKPVSDRTRGRFIQTWANFDKPVTTQGAFISVDYRLSKKMSFYGNYTWSKISDIKGLIAGFNTPKNKFNLGANGLIVNNLTYSINYRWSDTYTYFMPFDEGVIKAFGTLDAQVNYQAKPLKTTFKIGGTNLTNANAISVYGSAPISRIVYVGAVFDLKY
ncbi:Vitamin B12 transporter BtuB [Emticicia aquatica]|uniref:Vitamin B12 transporter BtuB n=1 Tax=Emticicia aquatica TaxID=1681835 RepID=A0ABM9ARI6_9BACT|nr:TonB-dependent receptor plug domain-containing protein [Emticicia aquatica]CAH0995903.1 Vitamin B12 transporter BtuB [Emticicia aquatica]